MRTQARKFARQTNRGNSTAIIHLVPCTRTGTSVKLSGRGNATLLTSRVLNQASLRAYVCEVVWQELASSMVITNCTGEKIGSNVGWDTDPGFRIFPPSLNL